jgi:hypothetical protein
MIKMFDKLRLQEYFDFVPVIGMAYAMITSACELAALVMGDTGVVDRRPSFPADGNSSDGRHWTTEGGIFLRATFTS